MDGTSHSIYHTQLESWDKFQIEIINNKVYNGTIEIITIFLITGTELGSIISRWVISNLTVHDENFMFCMKF